MHKSVIFSILPENISRWLSSRSESRREFFLSQKNIYIFPSKAGFVFTLLILLMFLTAINYQNSLIYLFTFFWGAVFFVSIWLCFLNMNGLHIVSLKQLTCFEGEMLPYEIELSNMSHPSIGIRLGVDKLNLTRLSILPNEIKIHHLLLPAQKRGMHSLSRLRIESVYPFGFIMAWTWLKLESNALVFPKPIEGEKLHIDKGAQGTRRSRTASEDLTALMPYQQGDSFLRVVWKQLAAKDQLIVRKPEFGSINATWLTWEMYGPVTTEQKLQHLCFDILDLHRKQQKYGLTLPGVTIAPSSGQAHQYACLKALALFGFES